MRENDVQPNVLRILVYYRAYNTAATIDTIDDRHGLILRSPICMAWVVRVDCRK